MGDSYCRLDWVLTNVIVRSLDDIVRICDWTLLNVGCRICLIIGLVVHFLLFIPFLSFSLSLSASPCRLFTVCQIADQITDHLDQIHCQILIWMCLISGPSLGNAVESHL